jgi:hypothetical protein
LVLADLVLLLPLATASCGQPPNAAECAALLDRYVSLLATSDRPTISETELIRLRQEARELSSQNPAFRDCPSRVSRRQLDCALSAPNADRFEQCLL